MNFPYYFVFSQKFFLIFILKQYFHISGYQPSGMWLAFRYKGLREKLEFTMNFRMNLSFYFFTIDMFLYNKQSQMVYETILPLYRIQ